MTQTIAFIGLGNMGGPMAANLVKAGYAVRGSDLSPACREVAAGAGVTLADDAKSAVAGADVIITMLPSGAIVRAVWSDLVPAAKAGALMIDCSTIDVDTARAVAELAQTAGMDTIDAPVSGGTGGATAGTLTFMVGGSDAAFARAQEILQHMGKKIVHCGPAGAGQAAKICNNMILGITMAGVAEAFVLGEKLGLSHQALFDVASTSSGQCWSINSYCPVPGPVTTAPSNNEYKPGFAAALMLKDMRLSQEAAASAGAVTEMGAKATALYERFADAGHGGTDFSGIINQVRQS